MIYSDEKYKAIRLNSYPTYDLDGQLYTGGSQGWLKTYGHIPHLSDYSCGLVAAADLLSVLTGRCYTAAQFLEFAEMLNHKYTRVIKYIGVNGFSLARGIGRYSKRYGLNIHASWGVRRKDYLERIYGMLKAGVPVILGIGRDIRLFHRENGIWFYRKHSSGVYEICAEQGKIQGHYVTVTAIEEVADGHGLMLEIVSWGQKFYIDYEEYCRYVDGQPMGLRYVLSNMLNVT